MNIRLIAVEAGDALKYDTTVNEIDRIGSAVFPFQRDEFPLDSITSVRAKHIYNWLNPHAPLHIKLKGAAEIGLFNSHDRYSRPAIHERNPPRTGCKL